jgi:hypothetical protein
VILVVATGCGGPATPSVELTGSWDFTFSALAEAWCPAQPELMPGCAGSGRLVLARTTPRVEALHSYRASCQSCRGAFDYGVTDQPLTTARLDRRTFQFALAGCRFAAEAAESAPTITGTVVCTVSDGEPDVRGAWAMSRR